MTALTARDWAAILADDPDALFAYCDWLEEQGMDVVAQAARALPQLAELLIASFEVLPVVTHADFRLPPSGGDDQPGFRLVNQKTGGATKYRDHPAAALVAGGAYYGGGSPAFPCVAWIEAACGLARTTVWRMGAGEPAIRTRFAVRK